MISLATRRPSTPKAVPREDRQITSFGGDQGYATAGWYPCRTNGKTLDLPPTTPSFAVSVVKGVAVWTDEEGQVTAAKLGG